ncbi:MAG: iron-sulfur cluster assembly protein [Proteobacteria bacterium]|nr:iron-sulfur cluster assembly protein [Pseudomonadota bacterium]MDA1136168.1 iron-sulfur cluster assembly protein [Pseudomonadota bacterium]
MKDIDNLPLSAFMPHHPSDDPHAPFTAKAGKKNNNCNKKIQLFEVVDALETVYDPEIPVNIYDLGLIYDIQLLKNNDIKIKMSLTAPGCPVAGEMPGQVADTIAKIPEVGLIEVELVWEPAWTKDRMSKDAKMALDIY